MTRIKIEYYINMVVKFEMKQLTVLILPSKKRWKVMMTEEKWPNDRIIPSSCMEK